VDPPWLWPVIGSEPEDTRYVAPVEDWTANMAAVLIVDSYRDEAEMYAQYLSALGARVDYVRTPEDALARLPLNPPAVIVTDMIFQWSAYDGPGFLRAVRKHPECATTNLIVLSGFTRPIDRQRARAAGADRFLLKPCAPDELRRHIESALYARALSTRATWNWPDDDGPAESAPPRLRL
jgi:two-component system, chemotaxis family, response regulator PixG